LRIARRIMPAQRELQALKLPARKYKYSGTPVAENRTATLFLTACLPFEDFFASTPSAGPQVGYFA
jgi:hypothetical protein